MKTLLLYLLLSDSTVNFTAKEASRISISQTDTTRQRAYNYAILKIKKSAESKEREVLVTFGRKEFAIIYDSKPRSQTWDWLLSVKSMLESKGFSVKQGMNGWTTEMFFQVEW